MQNKLKWFLIIILCLTNIPAKAVDMITATVDKNEIFLGDVVRLSFSISDPNLRIKFPEETPDYRVEATSTTSSFQIINGVTSQNKTINYVIKPLRVGNINLPEATASDGVNTYKSQNIVIAVTAGNRIDKLPVVEATAIPEQQVNPRTVFARINISNTQPYVNEQVHLSLKVYHRGNLVEINPGTLQIPLSDFVKKMDNKAKEFKERVDGVEYLVYQLDFTVFPLKPGTLVIPEHEIEGIVIEDAPFRRGSFDPFRMVNPFMVRKAIKFKTNSVSLSVKAVPEAGQPANYTGYVGALAVTHQISSLEIEAGDAITLNTKIYGAGSANTVETDFIKESKQYSLFKDKEESSEQLNNSTLYFETLVSTALVPNKDSGRVLIETQPLISFNPKTKSYEEHGKEVFEINIIPNKNKKTDKANSKKTTKKEIKQEILSVSKGQILGYQPEKYNAKQILLLIVLLNLIFAIYRSYLIFTKSSIGQDSASNKALLKEIRTATDLAEISKLFKDFVNKKGTIENSDLLEKINKFTNETDRFNYSGSATNSDKLEYFKESATGLIKELNKAK